MVGLVPCYPVCYPLPTFVHRGFASTPPVAPSAPIPLVGFPSTPLVAPPAPIPLVGFPSAPPVAPLPPIPLDTTHGGCAALSTQPCLVLSPLHHESFGCAPRNPRYHVPVIIAPVDHSAVSTPDPKGECSVDPSVARDSLRSSDYVSMPSLKLSARSRVLPTSHRPEHCPTG